MIASPSTGPLLDDDSWRDAFIGVDDQALGHAEDVAYAALFLACDESAFVTAANSGSTAARRRWSLGVRRRLAAVDRDDYSVDVGGASSRSQTPTAATRPRSPGAR